MTYKFSLTLNDIMRITDISGLANATFDENNLIISKDNLLTGMPSSLPLLAASIPADYLSFRYSIKPIGVIFGHDCNQTNVLYIYGFVRNITTGNLSRIASTGPNNDMVLYRPDSCLADVPGSRVVRTFVSIEPPIFLGYDGPDLISSLHTYRRCEGDSLGCGSGCPGCTFYGFDLKISLIIDVTINIIDYCIKGTNIHNDLCYNYMGDYINKYGSNSTIDSYLSSYCASKYPNKNLSIFNDPNDTGVIDTRDYDICACNMDQKYYDIFLNYLNEKLHTTISLGSIKPNCLFPACLLSRFKNSRLGIPRVGAGPCPVPQCLNIVDIHGNDIIGDVVVNQHADCKSYGIYTPPSDNTSPTGPSISPKAITYNKYTYVYIIVGVVLLIIIITIIIVVISRKKQ